uniref:Uncharacterized protein n=1 Tax=Anguilla anguilla TaxID=7936 RepID=A0A0E9S5K3_ANGAN
MLSNAWWVMESHSETQSASALLYDVV